VLRTLAPGRPCEEASASAVSHTRFTEPAPADTGIPTSLIRRCRRAGRADDDQSVPERAPPNHERALPPIAGSAPSRSTRCDRRPRLVASDGAVGPLGLTVGSLDTSAKLSSEGHKFGEVVGVNKINTDKYFAGLGPVEPGLRVRRQVEHDNWLWPVLL